METDGSVENIPIAETPVIPAPAAAEAATSASNQSDSTPTAFVIEELADADPAAPTMPKEPPPSYVKLAMRNMVRKRGTSLQHFFLTATGLLAVFVGLAYLTR